jgi:hypothetical protein
VEHELTGFFLNKRKQRPREEGRLQIQASVPPLAVMESQPGPLECELQRLDAARHAAAESTGSLPLLDALEGGLPRARLRGRYYSTGKFARALELGGKAQEILRARAMELSRWLAARVRRISSSSTASRVLFIAVVVSVIAGEVAFFFWCFAPNDACTCQVGAAMVCPDSLLVLLVPIIIGAAMLSMLCNCLPQTVQTLWWVPEGCAIAAARCCSLAARVSRARRAALYWFWGAQSPEDLLLWPHPYRRLSRPRSYWNLSKAFKRRTGRVP